MSTTRASRPGRSFPPRRPSTTPRPTRASSGAGRTAAGCDRVLGPSSPGLEWDVNSGAGSSFTTDGNNAKGVHNWFSNNPFTVGTETATPRPDRDYVYGWTNQWFEQRCNPDTTFTSAARNDIDAARANLFAGHNRMHDWSYHLGFTEETFNLQKDNFGLGGLGNDHEQGNAQAGGVSGGPASGFAARDNANQITPPDGQAPITNMYLWQPIAGAFYAPCVDGDFDMSVIGHEYTHAISNRMVAGPNTGLSGSHGGAMGESWSDLAAIEILNEYGFVPIADENRFAVGPYVTGDKRAGIRNYGMNASPLNFSNVGYDFVCNVATCPLLTQVHADGEIWSATNFAIRQALTARYGAGTPALQAQCADGLVDPGACPGNRRWIQLVFDAFLLLPVGAPTMLDARDAMLAADLIRFGGANQDLLWNTFASRGFGQNAASTGPNDVDPLPSFESPTANEATLIFEPVSDDGPIAGAKLFVGRYEARTTPVADTDPATSLGSSLQMVAGTYELLAQAPGYGMKRVSVELKPGMIKHLQVNMPANLAVGCYRRDRDRRRDQPRQADRRHGGDELGLARLACRRQAGDGPARSEQAVAPGRTDPGERGAADPASGRPGRGYRGAEPLLGVAPVPDPDLPGEGGRRLHARLALQRVVHQRARCLPVGRAAAARS